MWIDEIYCMINKEKTYILKKHFSEEENFVLLGIGKFSGQKELWRRNGFLDIKLCLLQWLAYCFIPNDLQLLAYWFIPNDETFILDIFCFWAFLNASLSPPLRFLTPQIPPPLSPLISALKRCLSKISQILSLKQFCGFFVVVDFVVESQFMMKLTCEISVEKVFFSFWKFT